MQNTTLDFQQLTPIADRLDCRRPRSRWWLDSIHYWHLHGWHHRGAAVRQCERLFRTGTQNQETLEAFGDSVKPISDATVF